MEGEAEGLAGQQVRATSLTSNDGLYTENDCFVHQR